MLRRVLILTLAGVSLLASLAFAGDRIYGTVRTRDGGSHTGVIRWDRNETCWDHTLDAQKNDRVKVSNEGGLELRVFGLRVSRSGHDDGWVRSQFGVPFGELASLEPGGGHIVALTLKNGERLEVRDTGDVGPDMRGLVVTGEGGSTVEIAWGDVARVDFAADPAGESGDRLYGTAETEVGDFTGFIVWDRDEALPDDVLDGDDENGRRRRIRFGDIRSIEADGSRAALVTLRSGEQVRLDGTNDVNSGNRGIEITIPGLGKVEAEWKNLHRLVFTDPPRSPVYADFDGGDLLRGTVTTTGGASYTGEIQWDLDESHTWEALDGRIDDVNFHVLFGNIVRIDRVSADAARVRLDDGLELELSGSNDVDEDNKGIRVRRADGTETDIAWDDFSSAVFQGR